jgi:hypothetical protein
MPINVAVKSATKSPAAPPPTTSWMKKGVDATAAMQTAEYAAKAAKEAADKMRRFWLEAGEERTVTFLDGDLSADGGLDCVVLHEHFVQLGPKKYEQFICVQDTENCPLCASGNRADTVAVFTIIDHTPYTIQSGPNQGKTISNVRKLYVAKPSTYRDLKVWAAKKNGLRGWTVEISRQSDQDARVGKMFNFVERQTPDTLTEWGELGQPADYAQELTYLTADQIVATGACKAISGPGYSKPGVSMPSKVDQAASDQM